MKLIEEHQQHQAIYNKGYRFDPVEETFFAPDLKKFVYPDGYDDWKVKKLVKNEYLKQRMDELGLTEKDYTVELFDKDGNRCKMPVFTSNKYGDIEILQYSVHRKCHTYDVKTTTAGTLQEYCVQKRLNPLYSAICQGKYDFSEAKNTPFWHPLLIEKFEAQEEIDTLVITEGQFKAFKATNDGVLTVGITSITHYREKRTDSIHTEIIEFIHRCKVKNVVILWDGDCRNVSMNSIQKEELEDLSIRPGLFYSSARNIKKYLQKVFPPKRLNIYFGTIKTEDISTNPKGIDDLLLVANIKKIDIQLDFQRIGTIPGYYIDWVNITTENGEKAMREFFCLNHVSDFYRLHSEKIKNRNFIFYGTTYRIDKGMPVVEVDKNLKKYMRIGPDYFRLIKEGTYNNDGEKIREDEILVPWKASEITRDFNKDALSNLIKLDGFCNIPNHINYKQIVDNKWNLYSEIKHDAVSGDWKTIEKFLKHVFQDQYEMGLDYIQILYSMPYQKLPVLTLASKEEGTGKSTFGKLLYLIFQNNMTFVTPEDILGQWSSHWVSKLIVASEETFFDDKKGALDKIKNISTADKIMRNERFVNSNLIDCFVKFVFFTNHEDDFVKLNGGSSRFWIIKVKQISEEDKDTELGTKMQDEIPHFIHYLQNRTIANPKRDRMWFHPEQYKTEAFYNVVKNSEPSVIKDLRIHFEDYFLRHNVDTLDFCVKDLRQFFGVSGNDFWLNKIIREYFNCQKQQFSLRYEFFTPNNTVNKDQGRYFTIYRSDFVSTIKSNQSDEIKKEVLEENDLPF